jgi:arylsulfatase A-like enzyme
MKPDRPPHRSGNVCSHFILLTLALALAFPGCNTPGQEDVQEIDLIDLLPPDRSIELVDPLAPRSVWNFAQGLPEGWTAGPPGVKVLFRPGGIMLESPDGSAPWVETQVTVDIFRYQSVLAVMDPEKGQPAILFYAFDDPPYFLPSCRVRVESEPRRNQQLLTMRLPSPDAIQRPIQALRLYTGARGCTSVLKRVILQPRRENFIVEHVLSRSRIGLGSESRHCWRVAGNDTLEVTCRLPEGRAQLSFAVGTLRGQDPAELPVELFQGETLLEQVHRQPFPGPRTGWREERVDLSRWRGEEVTFRFRIEGNSPQSIRLVGTPLIRTITRSPRPSVLLIVLDAQRADRFSLYGHQRFTSPNLARLAREGMLFTGATAPCSWTIPSVAATFTGLHADPEQLAKGHGSGLAEETTLAQRFANAGYATGGFASNSLLTDGKGFARGFDTWFVSPYLDLHPTAEELTDRAMAWIGAHRDEETFCYIHYMDPHGPYTTPWPAAHDASRTGSGGLDSAQGWEDGYLWALVIGGEQIGPEGVELVSRKYERGGEYTDFQIGRLLATLRREGLLERTAVLVTADHGEELHDHGYWSHGTTLYQEVLNIPMILRLPVPGPEAGTVVHTPVSLVDVAPTLSAIAGLPDGAGWSDGQDMRRLPRSRTVYSATTAHAPLRFSVIQPPWKYIYFNRKAFDDAPPHTAQGHRLRDHGQPGELLFNLDDDPGEQQNLMGQYPAVEAEMRGLMEAWFAEAGSDLLVSAPRAAEAIDEEELERLRALGYLQ